MATLSTVLDFPVPDDCLDRPPSDGPSPSSTLGGLGTKYVTVRGQALASDSESERGIVIMIMIIHKLCDASRSRSMPSRALAPANSNLQSFTVVFSTFQRNSTSILHDILGLTLVLLCFFFFSKRLLPLKIAMIHAVLIC